MMTKQALDQLRMRVSDLKLEVKAMRDEYALVRVVHDRNRKALSELTLANRALEGLVGTLSSRIVSSDEYISELTATIMLVEQDMAVADEQEVDAREEERHG